MKPSLAVVGSGPAAFYTVLRAVQKCPSLRVDMFERQCFPYGLTRFGVAPDHPEVKNCQDRFVEVANGSDFRFYGNCEVGKNVKLADLAANFDAVLLAYGSSSERKLGIPGETTIPGVLSARHFVGWYNGEPEYQNLDIARHLSRARNATIIGNGNVALDVARILLRKPEDLHSTDISQVAEEALKTNRVKHVDIVARRGLLHSAFTNKELRELQREPGTSMLPVDPVSELEIVPKNRQDKRKLDLLKKIDKKSEGEIKADAIEPRTWKLSFLRSPHEFVPDAAGGLKGINWAVNKYADDGSHILPTESHIFEPTDLVFTSIGYKSVPIPGLQDLGIEFDDKRGIIPRQRGKVPCNADNIFASGWVTTGPVGVIAATMMDSFSVGDEIASFVSTVPGSKKGRDALCLEPTSRVVSWQDWEKLDAEELKRGQSEGKIRTKFLSSKEALDWLDKN